MPVLLVRDLRAGLGGRRRGQCIDGCLLLALVGGGHHVDDQRADGQHQKDQKSGYRRGPHHLGLEEEGATDDGDPDAAQEAHDVGFVLSAFGSIGDGDAVGDATLVDRVAR